MVELKVYGGNAAGWSGGAVVLLLREEDCRSVPEVPCRDAVKELAARKDFTGKAGTSLRVPLLSGGVRNLFLVGLGSGEDEACSAEAVRNALTAALREAGRHRCESALVPMEHLNVGGGRPFGPEAPDWSVVVGEAAGLSGYAFDKYKERKEDDDEGAFALREVLVPGLDEAGGRRGMTYAAAQVAARDLANEPGCVINPPALADRAQVMAKELGLDCEVWDEARLKEERMGALLAVGSGSATPPRLIRLSYVPGGGKARRKVVFVGKGITFDSGGLDIKPASSMTTMKGDKSGACCVMGILRGAAEMKLDVEVHGILASAENMPSGSSFRPDDIVRARNGKTIEINNTDAEGRLVLADALCLASEMRPDAIVDIATLTGACAVALGNWRAGLFSRSDDLSGALLASARRRGERFWRLPAEDDRIAEKLKSPFADLVNSGQRYGGATFAALFLGNFVDRAIPWAHLDIAGVDFMEKAWGVYARGASAFGVRTCLDYLASL